MGTPTFALPCLEAVAQHTQLLAVVCQPDKPVGRGLASAAPATKQWALSRGIPVVQPVSVRPDRSDFLAQLQGWALDLVVVVAYGKILPAALLAVPRLGFWNVHASLLPKYRGAAPIQWSLMHGEIETGVSLMQLDAGMDTGPVFAEERLTIAATDTAQDLQDKLAELGAGLLAQWLLRAAAGPLPPPTPQDHSQATMAPLLTKEHGAIDFSREARLVAGQIQGVTPWPGAYTTLPSGEILKLFDPVVVAGVQHAAPGTCLQVSSEGLVVACGTGAVCIREVQSPGRKRMPAAAWAVGARFVAGPQLSSTRLAL